MDNCLFCKILAGEIPSTCLYEDEDVKVIRDIAPAAPTHLLVIPKKHIPDAAALTGEDANLLAKVFVVAKQVCDAEGITNGYRIVTNVGDDAGQTVQHLHFHVLAGKKMGGFA